MTCCDGDTVAMRPRAPSRPKAWPAPKSALAPVTYRQNKKKITGINELATPTVFPGNVFGLAWSDDVIVQDGMAKFPTFFRDAGDTRESITAADVPAKTTLRDHAFPGPRTNPPPYTAEPLDGSWATPGPAAGPFETILADGSTVRYFWYRFIDQPVFQQFDWSDADTQRPAGN